VPALVLPADVSCAGIDGHFRIPAKIDTGASVSAIPAALISKLELVPVGSVRIRGACSERAEEYPTYYVTISINDRITAEAEVVCLPRRDCLIGRDILNQLVLHADGPAKEFEIAG
jgi:hypothetical protein